MFFGEPANIPRPSKKKGKKKKSKSILRGAEEEDEYSSITGAQQDSINEPGSSTHVMMINMNNNLNQAKD
jgi:hypothetical protein